MHATSISKSYFTGKLGRGSHPPALLDRLPLLLRSICGSTKDLNVRARARALSSIYVVESRFRMPVRQPIPPAALWISFISTVLH